jgi:hypothetical protein
LPLAERVGMQKIVEQYNTETVSKVSRVIAKLGFDLHLIGSENYVLKKFESLSDAQSGSLKKSLYQQ